VTAVIGPARKWEERRQQLAARKPHVRVDRCVLTDGEKGTYQVTIEGFGLLPAITPPRITVGGVPLEQVRVEHGGRRLTGVLSTQPRGTEVIVDLGYARADGETTE
jgi:hypothetical protein